MCCIGSSNTMRAIGWVWSQESGCIDGLWILAWVLKELLACQEGWEYKNMTDVMIWDSSPAKYLGIFGKRTNKKQRNKERNACSQTALSFLSNHIIKYMEWCWSLPSINLIKVNPLNKSQKLVFFIWLYLPSHCLNTQNWGSAGSKSVSIRGTQGQSQSQCLPVGAGGVCHRLSSGDKFIPTASLSIDHKGRNNLQPWA